MKRSIAMLGLLLCAAANASHEPEGYYAWADVVDVEPVVESRIVREPQRDCSYAPRHHFHDEYDAYAPPRRGSGAATLIGGVIGGLIGNQFGGGNGRKAFTVAGALAGASIANDISRSHHPHPGARYGRHGPPVRHCTTVVDSRHVEQVVAYRVTYRYHGQEFVREMSHHPGERIRVLIEVAPA